MLLMMLMILALICFIAAAAGRPTRPNLGWLGLAFWVLVEIIQKYGGGS